MPPDLLDEITFSPGQGRRAKPLVVDVVRALTPEDLADLTDPGALVVTPFQSLKRITHAHHSIAKLLVKGYPNAQVSEISGYAPAYISTLQRDPAFAELVSYYRSEREIVFVDTLERMKALGLATLDELQHRLAEDPDGWSNRELMEMAKLMLGDTGTQGGKPAGGGGNGINLQVNFIRANHQEAPGNGPGPIVHLEPGEYQS